jgi:hypothetical protein
MTSHGGRAGPRRPGAAIGLACAAAILAACTFPDLATPSPRPSPTPVPSPTAAPTPTPASPTPTPHETPDAADIPDFAAGEIIASLIDGLRVRQRPGIDALVTTGLLPLDAEMQVVMGPFPADGFGWYLVTDADPDEPQFDEGWVAAGFEPDAFLRATARAAESVPYVASMAATGDAEEGPVQIDDDVDHAIRWIAADPDRTGCAFAVSLTPAGGEPVPTIRATVGRGIDRGTLQPQTFDALGVRGAAFVAVTSDCAWALVITRVPDPAPEPSVSTAP